MKIAFVPYMEGYDEAERRFGEFIAWSALPKGMERIRYSRTDALSEGAIVPLHFRFIDGKAEWSDSDGLIESVDTLTCGGYKTTRRGLFTALHTEFALQVLDECIKDWLPYKKKYPKAKLLVVSPYQTTAKEHLDYITGQGKWKKSPVWTLNALIAISEDSKEAQDNIRRFKGEANPATDILVTVGMAYEGLDVKDISHVACLTHIRSVPWLLQCWDRANRVNGWKQFGSIWLPDDVFAREIFDKVKAEEDAFIHKQEEGGGGGDNETTNKIVPMKSIKTRERTANMLNEDIDYTQTEVLRTIMVDNNLEGINIFELHRVCEQYNKQKHDTQYYSNDPLTTPSQREKKIRTDIETIVRRVCAERGMEPWELNNKLKTIFNKSRADMEYKELISVWNYLQEHYLGKYNEEHDRSTTA